MNLLTRRGFFAGWMLPAVSLLGFGTFGPFRAARAAVPVGTDGGFRREVAKIFTDPEGARTIGRHYLAAHPEDATGARRLAAALRRQQWAETGTQGWRRALADRRRRDLDDGVVVTVEGWVLARTEARACALIVL